MDENQTPAPPPKPKAPKQISNLEINKRVDAMADHQKEIAAAVDDQGDQLESLEKRAVETDAKVDEVLNLLRGMSSRNQPLRSAGHVDADELSAATGMLSDGGDPTAPLVESSRLVDVNSPDFKAKADQLAFMSEKVEVYIHTTSEKFADSNFLIGVNGFQVNFIRGQKRWVPRFIIEGLARAKPRQYDNEEYTMSDGRRAYRYPMRIGVRYPFTVTSDPNPRGEKWLERLLQEV